MPNYCSNDLYVRGTKENVLKFINKGLGVLGAHADNLNEAKELVNKYGLYNKNNPLKPVQDNSWSSHKDVDPIFYYSLECYVPMPDTYHEWDTTNDFRSEYPVGSKEYQEEQNGYEAAKKLQSEQYGLIGWYKWKMRNYGTKWNACIDFCSFIENDNDVEVHLYIETAWSPCDNWLETVQDENKYVRFRMVSEEPGNVFKYEYEADGYQDNPESYNDNDEVTIQIEDLSAEYAEELKSELEDMCDD